MTEAPPVEPASRLVSTIRIIDPSPASAAKPTEEVPHVDTGKLGDRETRHRTGRVETKVETKVADALSDMPPEKGVKALATMASTDRTSGVKPPRNRRDSSAGPPETKSESSGSPPREPPDEAPPTPGAPGEEPEEPSGGPIGTARVKKREKPQVDPAVAARREADKTSSQELMHRSHTTEEAFDADHFALMREINLVGGDDGTPISYLTKLTAADGSSSDVTFLAATDGAGGSGARKYSLKTASTSTNKAVASEPGRLERSGARIGGREVRWAVQRAAEGLDPDHLTHQDIKTHLEEQIKTQVLAIQADRRHASGGLKSSMQYDFPSTVSAVVGVTKEGKTTLNAYWKGDSPICIVTPDGAFTTIVPGSGDDPMRGDMVFQKSDRGKTGDFSLHSAQITIPEGTPYLALTASDALVKMGATGTEVQTAATFLDLADAETKKAMSEGAPRPRGVGFKNAYEKSPNCGDDFTIAMSGSNESPLKPGQSFRDVFSKATLLTDGYGVSKPTYDLISSDEKV